MTTVTDALLPCPFCGNEPYSDEETAASFGRQRTGDRFAIACSWCEVSAPGCATMPEAIAAWNTRADRQAAILEGMEIALNAAIERLGAIDVEAAFQNLNTPTGRAAILAAHTRAKAMDELIAGDADLYDSPPVG